jgi:uncharacterized protein YqjF (DUF2071 family)
MSDAESGGNAPCWDLIARDVDHRPWPLPSRPWIVAQSWRDVLFAHWPVSVAVLRPHIPRELRVDTFDGQAWVGVVPFHLRRIAPRGTPHRIGLAFPELNVRTYIRAEEKPGVWFFSLDAASLVAVLSARLAFHLPYYWARMRMSVAGDSIAFLSYRQFPREPAADFIARYRPTGPVFRSVPGSLEKWLTARYCLYTADHAGRIYRAEIHHPPWPLQLAEAEIDVNTMTAPLAIPLRGEPLLHVARRLDVMTWAPERVAGGG